MPRLREVRQPIGPNDGRLPIPIEHSPSLSVILMGLRYRGTARGPRSEDDSLGWPANASALSGY